MALSRVERDPARGCENDSYVCCRCGKGPGVTWLGAYTLGEHRVCVSCYTALVEEWGCRDD